MHVTMKSFPDWSIEIVTMEIIPIGQYSISRFDEHFNNASKNERVKWITITDIGIISDADDRMAEEIVPNICRHLS